MKLGKWIAFVFSLLLLAAAGGPAWAQPAEPSVHQIYQAADSGDLSGAQTMIDQVLQKHPRSAKAHYVKAELSARQHDAATARSELQAAERLEPGLPFAKPQAVSALRAEINNLASARSPGDTTRSMGSAPGDVAPARPHGFPVGTVLVFAAVVLGVLALLRRRPAAPPMGPDAYGPGYGSGGPYNAPYGPNGAYGPGPYGPGGVPQQGSMGSSLARGLGTGLAIGAGAVAAEEIGRRIFHHDQGNNLGAGFPQDPSGAFDPNLNADMGGQDFGMTGNESWDDAGGGGSGLADDAGLGDIGGDWDNS